MRNDLWAAERRAAESRATTKSHRSRAASIIDQEQRVSSRTYPLRHPHIRPDTTA
jgi:hypothetical protein